MHKINIAIDGPAAAGKSTVARHVARALGFVYIDTGAMYRAVTWSLQQQGLKPENTRSVIEMAERIRIELRPGDNGQQVFVNEQDVTELIRSPEINRQVSAVASIPEVRELLVGKQKQLAADKGVVMDGRDIGTHVLPHAEVKVFLTASSQERALRRYKEMNDPTVSLSELEHDIERRDRLDQEREASPLRQAEDAVLVDGTGMPLDQVVDTILSLCKAKIGGG